MSESNAPKKDGFYLHYGHIDEPGVDHTSIRLIFVRGKSGFILGDRRSTTLKNFFGSWRDINKAVVGEIDSEVQEFAQQILKARNQ